MSDFLSVRDTRTSEGLPARILSREIDSANKIHIQASLATNVAARIRDASENYPNSSVWDEAKTAISPGDLIMQAGNTAGAGWIELSKSPFDSGGSTVIQLAQQLEMPMRILSGITMSQRAAGQHIASIELVSTDDWEGAVPIPDPVPVEILSASQATTIITINFATAPAVPFRIGQRVNVYGFVDNRLNVSSATVATTPSATQLTLVGNAFAFTSTTITTTLGNGAAFIERVDVIGGARNGIAILHESATATQCSAYSRSEGGLGRPSGSLAGSHQFTTGTDLAVALATAPGAYAFAPAVQTRIDVSRDGFVISDRSTGGLNAVYSGRYRHDEVVPNPARPYKLQFRLRSAKATSRPIAEIVSVTKAGSTTTTFITRAPHGLQVGQFIAYYGVSNQTAFAAQSGMTVASVVDANTFTCVTTLSTTATSYGGFVAMLEGQQILPGAVNQSVQSITRAGNVLTVVGSAAWAGPIIGEIVELYGVGNIVDGESLGVDGPYRVDNIATTTITLIPIQSAQMGDDITLTNAGGGLIRRTELRIHYTVVVDYEPVFIEPAQGGVVEQAFGTPVNVIGTVPVSGTIAAAGSVAPDAATPNPIAIGGRATNANIAAMSATGDLVHTMHTMIGALVQKPYAIPESDWQYAATLTNNTSTAMQAAAAAGIKRYLTGFTYQNTHASQATVLNILRGATLIHSISAPALMANPVSILFPTPLQTAAAEALNVQCATTGANVLVNAQGFTAP